MSMFTHYLTATKKGSNVVVSTVPLTEESGEQVGPNDRLASFHYCRVHLGTLLGKTLTIIDSSVTDSRQNKAMKDLIKHAFSDTLGTFSEDLVDQEVAQKIANDAVAEMSNDEIAQLEVGGVDITEVLGVTN